MNICFRYAHQVSIGDEVLVRQNYELIPGNVTNVSHLIIQGKNYLVMKLILT